MAKMGKPSDRQMAIWEYINKFRHEEGYSPSVREIGVAMDIKSTSTVFHHLRRLVHFGYLKPVTKIARGIVPTFPPFTEDEISDIINNTKKKASERIALGGDIKTSEERRTANVRNAEAST